MLEFQAIQYSIELDDLATQQITNIEMRADLATKHIEDLAKSLVKFTMSPLNLPYNFTFAEAPIQLNPTSLHLTFGSGLKDLQISAENVKLDSKSTVGGGSGVPSGMFLGAENLKGVLEQVENTLIHLHERKFELDVKHEGMNEFMNAVKASRKEASIKALELAGWTRGMAEVEFKYNQMIEEAMKFNNITLAQELEANKAIELRYARQQEIFSNFKSQTGFITKPFTDIWNKFGAIISVAVLLNTAFRPFLEILAYNVGTFLAPLEDFFIQLSTWMYPLTVKFTLAMEKFVEMWWLWVPVLGVIIGALAVYKALMIASATVTAIDTLMTTGHTVALGINTLAKGANASASIAGSGANALLAGSTLASGTAAGIATVPTLAFGAALWTALAPIMPIVLGITAVVAGLGFLIYGFSTGAMWAKLLGTALLVLMGPFGIITAGLIWFFGTFTKVREALSTEVKAGGFIGALLTPVKLLYDGLAWVWEKLVQIWNFISGKEAETEKVVASFGDKFKDEAMYTISMASAKGEQITSASSMTVTPVAMKENLIEGINQVNKLDNVDNPQVALVKEMKSQTTKLHNDLQILLDMTERNYEFDLLSKNSMLSSRFGVS